MKSSIDDELDNLRIIVTDRKNKRIIKEIIEKILDLKLADFSFKGKKSLKKISEYDFSVLDFVGNIENKKFEFYVKIIKGGEIKKSVFCCWSLLQEEYEDSIKETKDSLNTIKELDKVSIREEINKDYKNSVQISLEGNISYHFEVNFIELEKFIEKFELKSLKNLNQIKISNKDILLIMVMELK